MWKRICINVFNFAKILNVIDLIELKHEENVFIYHTSLIKNVGLTNLYSYQGLRQDIDRIVYYMVFFNRVDKMELDQKSDDLSLGTRSAWFKMLF